MSATITSSGTWSALSDTNRYTGAATVPKQFDDGGVDQEFGTASLDYFNNVGANADAYPEITQFIGLMAAGYSIPPGAAAKRMIDVLQSMYTGQRLEIRRTYP